MKTMRGITTKVAGAALATVMAFGGAAVFAAENGEQVYNRTFTVTAERSHALVFFCYSGTGASMTVPDTGYYTISFTALRTGDYHKELTIRNMTTGTRVLSAEGSWEGYALNNVYLVAGDTYAIDVYADDFMGFNILDKTGSADFSFTVTLENKENYEEEEEPDTVIPSMPQIVIGDESETDGPFDMYVGIPDTTIPSMPQIVIDAEPETDGPFDMYVGMPDTTIPSMPQIVIDEEPETDGQFDMYVGIPDTTIPSMPQIVIDAEPEAPTPFTMLLTSNPEVTTIDNTTVEDTTDESTAIENTTIANPDIANMALEASEVPVFTLTAAQIRELAVRNFIGNLYIDGLGRRADESEITEWTDKLMCGSTTATEAAAQILTSSELNEHDFDNEQIAAILNDVFNTESQSDILAQLNSGASVESVIEQLAGTDNWASKCAFYGVNV